MLAKMIIVILLISLYFYMFGRTSFEKYQKGGVLINKQFLTDVEFSPGMISWSVCRQKYQLPGLMILPIDPKTGLGSRTTEQFTSETGQELRERLDSDGYSYDQIVLSSNKPVTRKIVFTSRNNMLVHLLLPGPESVTTSSETSLRLVLNPNLSYYLSFIDPVFSFPAPNPKTVPQTLLGVKESAGKFLVFLEVRQRLKSHFGHYILQAVAQHKLDRKENPCDESEDYHYADCLIGKISETAGCQTYHTNISNIPRCSTFREYSKFWGQTTNVMYMESQDRVKFSKCLMPCRYMEYKVIILQLDRERSLL